MSRIDSELYLRLRASESEDEVRRADAKGDVNTVQIAGEGDPPQTADPVSAIRDKARRPVTRELESDSVEIERVDLLPTDECALVSRHLWNYPPSSPRRYLILGRLTLDGI